MLLEISYIGEHLLPGNLGHAAIVLNFVMSLLGMVAYALAANNRHDEIKANGWRFIGRSAFVIHGLSVFAVIGIIFYIMYQQYYEYQYVWAHVSEDLPLKYILASFWEGQEGSFLLWMFWHVILGFVLMGTAKKWESPVMSVLASIQLWIGSMILGLYFGFGEEAVKIGSNPLLLLRDTMNAPIFSNADYLALIKGNGLNPLLQNYWMTIHPPTLFLGFASTSIPFAFAVAGLWLKEHKAWLKPALTWALFSGAILGTGILMGAAWAYEALSFGGYWAWDPVENMSLVPWIILVAGIHTNLIARSTGHSIKSTYLFYLLTFILIVYSTFLTRSGVLGETSAHAFTEMGLETQLVGFILAYVLFSLGMYFANQKSIPVPVKEETTASKEFWMFIGTLVLLFSALLITASTSLPVYNKIREYFDPLFLGQVITEPIDHFNKYQLWIGIFVGLLSGGAQYLRWKEHNFSAFAKRFAVHFGIAAVITGILTWLTLQWITNAQAWQYILLAFSGIFAIVTNLDYLITIAKGNLKMAGSALSHIGFGALIIGVMATGLNKQHISSNAFAMQELLEDDLLGKNIMIMHEEPMFMNGYEVTYLTDSLESFTRTYTVNFKKLDQETGAVTEEFNVYPNILYDKQFTKIAANNPSTRHYWNKDIFTLIPNLPQAEVDAEARQAMEDSLKYVRYVAPLNEPFTVLDTIQIRDRDTSIIQTYTAQLLEINRNPSHPDYEPEAGDLAVGVKMSLTKEGETFEVEPMLALRGKLLYAYPVKVNEATSKIRLTEEIFESVFTPEEELEYNEFNIKQGDVFNYNGKQIQFAGFNKNPSHPNYAPEEGDIAVSAMLNVAEDGKNYLAQPVYLIRDNRPFNLKDEISALGLHFRFVSIDPTTESMRVMIAEKQMKNAGMIPIEIATNSLRTDWIVLEAIVFPGINLVWLGSILMMIGLTFSMFVRRKNKQEALA
ncbi:MAG: cytochrome c biogenesis protein CcsA [Saprospiraceae bacterium]